MRKYITLCLDKFILEIEMFYLFGMIIE